MANTLSLGSGNWGAKDSLLLGYYENGKKFFPETFDVTRATGGTRVNKDGLIETPAEIGSELITNGDFSNGSTDWDASVSGTSSVVFTDVATLNIDGSNSNVGIYQQDVFSTGKVYKVSLRMKASANFDAEVIESQGAVLVSTIATGISLTTSYQDFTFYHTATGNNDIFVHRLYSGSGANQNITIDNVSVKEYNDKNLARIDYLDDAKGALLTEPQSTNLVTYSESFNSWAQIQETSLIETETISPSGEANSIKFLSTGNSSKVRNNFSSVSGETYTFSVYCQNIDATQITILAYDGVNSFEKNIVTDINTSTWSRVSLTFTSTNTGAGQIQLGRNIPNGQSAYFWGAQLEQENALGYNGEYATSYIPTDGSTVTRNKDEVTNGGDANSFNSEEGVLYSEMASNNKPSGIQRTISINSGTNDNRISLYYHATQDNVIVSRVYQNNVSLWAQDILLSNEGTSSETMNKFALKYSSNGFEIWMNGVKKGSSSAAFNFPSPLSQLSFDRGTGGSPFFGKTKNAQVFNTALSDSDLLSLTTTGLVPYWKQYSAMATTLNYTNK